MTRGFCRVDVGQVGNGDGTAQGQVELKQGFVAASRKRTEERLIETDGIEAAIPLLRGMDDEWPAIRRRPGARLEPLRADGNEAGPRLPERDCWVLHADTPTTCIVPGSQGRARSA